MAEGKGKAKGNAEGKGPDRCPIALCQLSLGRMGMYFALTPPHSMLSNMKCIAAWKAEHHDMHRGCIFQ